MIPVVDRDPGDENREERFPMVDGVDLLDLVAAGATVTETVYGHRVDVVGALEDAAAREFEQRELRRLSETIDAGECLRWLHVFENDSRACSCGEFSSAEALREHNRRMA